MRRKVRSWESMEKEFGIDGFGNISPSNMLNRFIPNMKYICGKEIDVDSNDCYDEWIIEEWMLEPLEEEIKIKTIEDFPMVEMSDNGDMWYKTNYIYTTSTGRFVSNLGVSCRYMRPIKKHNVEELKRNARLT